MKIKQNEAVVDTEKLAKTTSIVAFEFRRESFATRTEETLVKTAPALKLAIKYP